MVDYAEIKPSSELNELQRQSGAVSFDLPSNENKLQLRYRFLRQGYSHRPETQYYKHPAPPFCRLFIFFDKGATITIDKADYELIPGKIWLIPPGKPFDICYYQGSELLFFHVCVKDFMGQQLFDSKEDLLDLDNQPLVALFEDVYKKNSDLLLRNVASTALSFLAEPYLPDLMKKASLATRFRVVFDVLENEPLATIRIEELAEQMNMTSSGLSKSFRRQMGIPLKAFIEQQTLKKAQELLLFTSMTTAEIAGKLGFNDTHYFYRYFKKRTGYTPSNYKKSQANLSDYS